MKKSRLTRRVVKRLAEHTPGLGRLIREKRELEKRCVLLREFIGKRLLSQWENDLLNFGEHNPLVPSGREIAHISWNINSGGAASIARKIHRATNERYGSFFFWGNQNESSNDPHSRRIDSPEFAMEMIEFGHKSSMRGFCNPSTKELVDGLGESVGLVHLHNPHPDYFNLFALPELNRRFELVWTLHDEYSYTGHCCYTMGCYGWTSDCSPCPHVKRYVELESDRAAEHLRLKRKIYSKSKPTLVCVSQWLADRVSRSILRDQDIRVIYNGIDTELFAPIDRGEARRRLGLPPETTLCGFSAHGGIHNPWKGGEVALELARHLRPLDGFLVSVGGDRKYRKGNIIELGYVANPEMMAAVYNATDLWIHPAKAESFGLVVAEAMACEIPVIASNVCAIPELVVHEETGLLVNERDVGSYLKEIQKVLRAPGLRQQMGSAARKRVLSQFSDNQMIAAYMKLYDELLEKRFLTVKNRRTTGV
jgi:glycosyltransferase involved in cell wall biosynthesis